MVRDKCSCVRNDFDKNFIAAFHLFFYLTVYSILLKELLQLHIEIQALCLYFLGIKVWPSTPRLKYDHQVAGDCNKMAEIFLQTKKKTLPFFQNQSITHLGATYIPVQWWNSERFGVITRQLQAAKCSLSSQIFLYIFILLENLRLQYCCTQCVETFARFAFYTVRKAYGNFMFNVGM
jgi:hypothetical protein